VAVAQLPLTRLTPYPQDPDITPTHTIKQLQQMYTNAPVTITEDVILSGIVVGSDSTGNLYKKIVVQDATAGIDIEIDQTNLFNTYPVGKRVYIYAKGLTLATYGGMLELGLGINDQNQPIRIPGSVLSQYIVTGTSNNVVVPVEVTIDQLNENYQNMLVKVLGVEFSNLDDTYADAVNKLTTNRTIKDCSGNTLTVRTSGYASFAGTKVPQGHGNMTGIYTFFNSEKQFIVRSLNDVSEMTGELCGGGGNPGGNPGGGTTLTEDFAALTDGGSTASSGAGAPSGTPWTGNDNFTAVDKAYPVGGMVKLGTSSVVGYITIKPLNLTANGGTFTVSFDVKGCSAGGTIIVSASGTDQTVTYTALMAGPTETKTVTFTGSTASTTVKIATGAPARAFLDNIVIKTN